MEDKKFSPYVESITEEECKKLHGRTREELDILLTKPMEPRSEIIRSEGMRLTNNGTFKGNINGFQEAVSNLYTSDLAKEFEEMDENVKVYIINKLIKQANINTNAISDGYHTFEELYNHRIELFIAYLKVEKELYDNLPALKGVESPIWMSENHSDGTNYAGWFILGIHKEAGEQITYHLPISKWEECTKFATIIENAPVWDGHTSNDVLQRLKEIE